jgi:hypothetical protein
MTEPLFFDCLTDAQVWSLFDTGVLQGGRLPVEVYERLERIAPDHGCYLFTWPAGVELPSLQDLIPGVASPGEEPPVQTHSHSLETRGTVERMRAAIEAFWARVHRNRPPAGGRIHVIATHPHLALRAGPYLEPRARDLHAMSLPELEAYLDDVLRVDEGGEDDAAASSTSR